MGVRKDTVVSFVPTLFGCFLGIPSLYVFKMVTCFSCCFLGGGGGGGGDIELLTPNMVIGSDGS